MASGSSPENGAEHKRESGGRARCRQEWESVRLWGAACNAQPEPHSDRRLPRSACVASRALSAVSVRRPCDGESLGDTGC